MNRFCAEVTSHDDGTILNFLLSCGPETLFAFCHPGARPGSSVWNGLNFVIRDEFCHGVHKKVAVVTTEPLTDNELWVEMQKGELLLFEKGVPFTMTESSNATQGVPMSYIPSSASFLDSTTADLCADRDSVIRAL